MHIACPTPENKKPRISEAQDKQRGKNEKTQRIGWVSW